VERDDEVERRRRGGGRKGRRQGEENTKKHPNVIRASEDALNLIDGPSVFAIGAARDLDIR